MQTRPSKRELAKKAALVRECALTREAKPVSELLRFALSPQGELVPDIDAKAPGRGVWITDSEAAIMQGLKKNVFARSLKQKIAVSSDLAQITRSRLEQRLKGALGLARKAGQLQTGATRVKSSIASGNVLALLTACDAASDGRRKMLATLRSQALEAGLETTACHFDILTSEQLGLALGQENVIHVALTHGAAAKSALQRVKKLARFNAQPDIRSQPAEKDTNETKIT